MKGGRTLKKICIVLISLMFAVSLAGVSFAGIEGSAHDFSAYDFTGGDGTSGGQICVVCHTPHNVDPFIAMEAPAPLWNHELSFANYNPYSSPTLQAIVGQPDGSAKLCLSCHDGTVAIDAFGGELDGTLFIGTTSQEALIGTDLSDDHPISFVYDDTLSGADPGLYDPATVEVTVGSGTFVKTGMISDVMLEDGKLQCSSCHSVHADFVAADEESEHKLLKISMQSSELCLACHNK
jgi:hypothetical protein